MGVASQIPVRGEGTREAGGTGRLVPGGRGARGNALSQAKERDYRGWEMSEIFSWVYTSGDVIRVKDLKRRPTP